jgi:hypothetical protein
MGTHNCAVHHAIFHIGVIGKVFKHPFPHAVVTPASKALIHAIPVAQFCGQQAPLCATTAYPFHGFQETTALCLVSHIGIRILAQEIPNARPLIVG